MLSHSRWIAVVGVVAVVFLVLAPVASAQAPQTLGAADVQTVAQAAGVDGATDLFAIIGNIINIFFSVLGVLLLLYFLYAGYLWMTAGGDQEQVQKAQTTIKNAVIGLVIIVSSFAVSRFILDWLAGDGQGFGGGGVTQNAGGIRGGSGFPGAAGALGAGLIEYHIPERDAREVPRNASIIMVFKQPIDPASAIVDYTEQTSTTAHTLNTQAIKIFQTGQEQGTTMRGQDVEVYFSSDKQSMIVRPKQLLGNSVRNTDYTVILTAGDRGLRLLSENGRGPSIFSAGEGYLRSTEGYSWRFEVSTIEDNTPPKIVSVIPVENGQYAPNVVVQMNFDKALNPLSADGILRDGAGFQNVEVAASPIQGQGASRPDGQFSLVNRLRTIEFVTNMSCGVNTCGRQVYCLPFSSNIAVRIKAATLSQVPPQARLMPGPSPFDGVVDYTGNSFDGNGDGRAAGPGDDDYAWRFQTTDRPNLDAPRITAVRPGVRANNVAVDVPVQSDFDSALQASTISSDTVRLRTNEPEELRDTFWWMVGVTPLRQDGGPAQAGDRAMRSRIDVGHRPYSPVQETPEGTLNPQYAPFVQSEVQNIYQNCFNPASSLTCSGNRNCCDDRSSSAACSLPRPLEIIPRP